MEETRKMWIKVVFVCMIISCFAISQTTGNLYPNVQGAQAYAGSFGGGYGGAYDTSGGAGSAGGGTVNVPTNGISNFDDDFGFSRLFNNYFLQMEKFHSDMANHIESYAYTSGDWKNAQASSSLTYDTPQSMKQMSENMYQQGEMLKHHIQTYGPPQSQPQGQPQGQIQGLNGAFASGTIGSNGAYQTAAVFPANPNMPNIINHPSASGIPDGNRKKFYGVISSSSSSTKNINGQQEHHNEAETIINDNGKITRYHTKNP